MSNNPTSLFPSIIPSSDDDLTPDEVITEIFEDNYKALRKGIKIVNEQYDHDIGVNGRSTKREMASYMANNMSRDGVQTISDRAFSRLEESDG